MKLFTRYNRINLLATVIIFLLAMLVFYFFLRQVLISQVDEDLEIEQTEIVAYTSQHQQLPPIIQQEDQQIFYATTVAPLTTNRFVTIASLPGKEDLRQLSFSLQLPDGWHTVIVSKSLEGTDHLTRSVATIALVTILLILTASFLLNRLLLRRLWQPFYGTLSALQHFRLGAKAPLQLPESSIDEFKLMNHTLQQVTGKAEQDYVLLKEFTENASHELQTPLAVIRSKLELLIQYDLNKPQSQAVQAAGEAVKTLVRLNRSLLLLAKIQNHQFVGTTQVNLKALLENKLDTFREIADAKGIVLYTTLNEKQQAMNEDLAGLLIGNLVSNAIRHNRRGGEINITLLKEKLTIGNTGSSLAIDDAYLFTRFYNPQKGEGSTGLGLAIVKQIVEVSGFEIAYQFKDDKHHFSILF